MCGSGGAELLLCIGFMTPVVSSIACLFELVSLLIAAHSDMRFTVLSSLNAAAIALLGPGAYSLDARLFGRRVIVFRSDGKVRSPLKAGSPLTSILLNTRQRTEANQPAERAGSRERSPH